MWWHWRKKYFSHMKKIRNVHIMIGKPNTNGTLVGYAGVAIMAILQWFFTISGWTTLKLAEDRIA
jgi:hypothetical protein